jgi:hypothetical protein
MKTVKIAKGTQALEGGMPHTHANIIIMNAEWFKHPQFSTFIHELVHINQREYPDKYRKLFTDLNFRFVKIQGFDDVMLRSRHNPDTFDPEIFDSDLGINKKDWIWYCSDNKRFYWLGAVFRSITPESLNDVEYLAYELSPSIEPEVFFYNGGIPISLSKFTEFNKYFAGISNNHYHPNEITAELIEKIISTRGKFAKSNMTTSAVRHIKDFITDFFTDFLAADFTGTHLCTPFAAFLLCHMLPSLPMRVCPPQLFAG